MDLVEFLNARLNEDHWEAFKLRRDGEWTADELARLWWYGDPPKSRSATDPIIRHSARYNPARALREVEAKRAILAAHEHVKTELPPPTYGEHDFGCSLCYGDSEFGQYGSGWCKTVRALAAVYSDHPDYRPEWKP